MKTTAFRLTLLFQLFALFSFAQKNAGLKTLLNKNSEFIFPQTPDKISAILGVKTVFMKMLTSSPMQSGKPHQGWNYTVALGKTKA